MSSYWVGDKPSTLPAFRLVVKLEPLLVSPQSPAGFPILAFGLCFHSWASQRSRLIHLCAVFKRLHPPQPLDMRLDTRM